LVNLYRSSRRFAKSAQLHDGEPACEGRLQNSRKQLLTPPTRTIRRHRKCTRHMGCRWSITRLQSCVAPDCWDEHRDQLSQHPILYTHGKATSQKEKTNDGPCKLSTSEYYARLSSPLPPRLSSASKLDRRIWTSPRFRGP
jgi:hypothetical protein